MKIRELLNKIQDYYGKYPSRTMAQEVALWISNCGIDIDALWKALTEEYSSDYGKVPDVAAFKRITDKNDKLKRSRRIYEDANGEVWSRGFLIGHYSSLGFMPCFRWGVPIGIREMGRITSPEHLLEVYAGDHIDEEIEQLKAKENKQIEESAGVEKE